METAITNTHTNTKEREESARPQFCFQPWHRLPSPQHTDICTWKRKQLAHKCSSNSWSHNYASNQCTSTEENVSTAIGSQQHRDGIFHGEGLPDNLLWVWPLLLQPPTMQTAAKQESLGRDIDGTHTPRGWTKRESNIIGSGILPKE